MALRACPLGPNAMQRGPGMDWVQQIAGGDAAALLAAVQAGTLLLCSDSLLHPPQAASASSDAGAAPAEVELRREQMAAGVEARLQRYDCAVPARGAAPAVVYA